MTDNNIWLMGVPAYCMLHLNGGLAHMTLTRADQQSDRQIDKPAPIVQPARPNLQSGTQIS